MGFLIRADVSLQRDIKDRPLVFLLIQPGDSNGYRVINLNYNHQRAKFY